MKISLIVVFVFISFYSRAQAPDVSPTQLVLLNHQKVLARYRAGSVITYRLKHHKEFVTSLIVEVRDFYLVTSFDTIPFEKIGRVSLKGQAHTGATNLFGNLFMAAGLAYFAVDQINSIVVHNYGYDNDPAVWRPAAVLVATGFILKQFYKRSQRIRYPAKLLAAPRGSLFYLPDGR